MARFACNSCDGVYTDLQRGGMFYYHACPAEVFVQRARLDLLGNLVQVEVRAARPNPRNENVRPDGRGIIQPGLGRRGA